MSWPVTSALEVLTTQGAGRYGSFPVAWTTRAGTRLVTYRDWDGVTATIHDSGGGSAWLIRNESDPALVITATALGANGQDPFVFQKPTSDDVVLGIRQYDAGEGLYDYYAAISSDEGQTFGSLALLAKPTEFAGSAVWSFFDFLPSRDGTRVLATAYGTETGQSTTSVGLFEVDDNLTVTLRGWIARAGDGLDAGNETGVIRLAGGRLLAIIRNAPFYVGMTCYSDDDGATWSARVPGDATATNFAARAPRGFQLSTGEVVVLGRHNEGGATVRYGAWWLLDANGARTFGPQKIHQFTGANNGGYFSLLKRAYGWDVYGYSDLNETGNIPVLVRCIAKERTAA